MAKTVGTGKWSCTEVIHMPTISREKYERLRNMNILDASRYDINARIDLIIQEILTQLQEWEKDAVDIYGPLKSPLKRLSIFD